jgi:hypothetical protein
MNKGWMTATWEQLQAMEGREGRQARLVWAWSAPRFGGMVGWIHERYYEEMGPEAYHRRIERVRKVVGLAPYYQIERQ